MFSSDPQWSSAEEQERPPSMSVTMWLDINKFVDRVNLPLHGKYLLWSWSWDIWESDQKGSHRDNMGISPFSVLDGRTWLWWVCLTQGIICSLGMGCVCVCVCVCVCRNEIHKFYKFKIWIFVLGNCIIPKVFKRRKIMVDNTFHLDSRDIHRVVRLLCWSSNLSL